MHEITIYNSFNVLLATELTYHIPRIGESLELNRYIYYIEGVTHPTGTDEGRVASPKIIVRWDKDKLLEKNSI